MKNVLTLALLVAATAQAASGPRPRRSKTLRGHDNFILSLDVHPEGRLLISSSADGTVRLWSVELGKARRTVRLPEGDVARCVRFSPDGRLIAAVVGGTILLLDEAGEEKRRLEVGAEVRAVAFSPDSRTLAAAAGALHVYAVDTGAEVERYGDGVVGVAFSPDARAVVLAGRDGVRVRARPDGSERTLHVGAARAVAFADGGKYVVVAGEDGQVRVLALDSGDELWSHGELASDSGVGTLGALVLAGIGEHRLSALGGEGGHEEWYVQGKTDDVQVFALAEKAKLMATAGEGSTIDLWNLK